MSKNRRGAANLDRVWVVDLESTCWETKEEQGDKPNEIIEIGICALWIQTGDITLKRSFTVRPQHSEVTDFCTSLTGWKPEDVEHAPTIDKVLKTMEQELGFTSDDVWFSCGMYDKLMLSSSPHYKHSLKVLYDIDRRDNPFERMRMHVDIKVLMALKEKLTKAMGMARMLTFYGEELEGQHHNGADDAYNTAKIVRRVLS